MFKKNIKPILMAGALALATTVSPVFANEDTNHIITIDKNFTIDKGNVNLNETFTYKVEYKGMYTYEGQALVTNTAYPYMFINSIQVLTETGTGSFQFTTGNSETTTGEVTLPGTQATLGFDAGDCIPGVYTYEISENSIANTDLKDYTVDDTHYTVYVTVKNNGSGKAIDSVSVRKTNAPNDTKSTGITFVNSLHEDKENALSVKKEVTGKYGDKTEAFAFTGTITLPQSTKSTSYSGTKYKADGTQYPGNEGTVEIGANGAVNFSLKDGEYVDFGKLPVGTHYYFQETKAGTDGYTTTIEGADFGNVTSADQNSAASGMVTNQMVAGATADELEPSLDNIVFKNDKDGNIDTGVIVNNMPYIALLGASGAGLVVLAASKKRSKK